MRRIIHIDMDCFFAAVEMRDQPALAALPIAVGGEAGQRGVIATCNYLARRYGVRSAMATAHALKLCPQLQLIHPRFALYKEVSRQLKQILLRFTPLVEMVSLDEAYLDVTDSSHCRGSATWMAERIRAAIATELQLTASAGVAPNKFLAKIASERNKPDGLCVITPHDVSGVLEALPLAVIPGVGPVTNAQLAALQLHTTADVRACSPLLLGRHFGRWSEQLLQLAHGVDERPVEPWRPRQSVAVETTFAQDLFDDKSAAAALDSLLAELEPRLARFRARFRNWQLKARFSDRVTATFSAAGKPLTAANLRLMLVQVQQKANGRGLRLLGIQAVLAPENGQLSLPLE